MKAVALVGALTLVAEASNVSGNCYEVAPSSQHYQLKWEAKGHNFFDDLTFATSSQTGGTAVYLDKTAALNAGIIKTTKSHAYMRVGDAFNTNTGPKRHSVKVSTRHRYKHFLSVLRYKKTPFGLGVWPAFWLNGAAPWPENGEVDVLEYAGHAGQQVSVHTKNSNHCKLSPDLVQKCGEMEDANKMDYDCYTDYPKGRLGCAPTTYAGRREPEYWSSNPGALAVEWTERFMKVFYFEDYAIPDDVDTDTPRPETWDEKWVIAYFPFAGSNEKHPGWCPNPADVLGPQKIILNIELCGDWGGGQWSPKSADPFASEWKGKRDRGECVAGRTYSRKPDDCCGNYIGQSKMNDYLRNNSYWDIRYLKIFQLTSGPAPAPTPSTTPRRRHAPAPTPVGTCTDTWLQDTDCSGADLLNKAVKDTNDCCELCSKTPGCGAFTHNVWDGHKDATCYLKKSCTETQKGSKRGCISGVPMQLAPTPPPPPPTPPGMCGGGYFETTDCEGADIKDKAMDNEDGCCEWCSQTPGCTAFTQNMVDGHGSPHCYLKKSCVESKRGWNGNAISGAGIEQAPTPAPSPSPPPKPSSRRRRSSPGGVACCSWAPNNACGDSTDYCKSNADACVICGGHWFDPAVKPEPCCSWAASNECGDTTDYCKSNADACVICGGHWVDQGTSGMLI